MKISLRNPTRALCLLSLTMVFPALASAQSMNPPATMAPAVSPSADAPKKPMVAGMDAMAQHMPMSGDADKDFANMMKMHLQHGVDMAQKELANGKSPAMKAMATRTIAAQKKDIVQLEQWLAKQK